MAQVPNTPKFINSNNTIHNYCGKYGGYWEASGNIHVTNIISGAVCVSDGGEKTYLASGDTLILNPYDRFYVSSEADFTACSFIIDATKIFDELCMPALTRFENFIFGDGEISYICKKVNSEYVNQSAFHENMLNSLISQLIIRLYRLYNAEKNIKPSEKLLGKQKIARIAVEYIYANCQNGVTTSEISEKINVSISYLCRCFKESTGVSVLEYAERIRCRKAREDLSLGIYSVTQVAEKYCFNSLSYFNRRYKKYCGENPCETLAKAKNKRCRSV